MNMNTLALAASLSDQDLLTRLDELAGREREATADLVAHLAVLLSRPSVYAGKGYGTLFGYCTQALRLSEDAACSRIRVARAGRQFPRVLDLLASGSVSLTSLRLLAPHLTPENHQAVLARAVGRTRQQVEALVAELAPQPDVPTTVRKLPAAPMAASAPAVSTATEESAPPLALTAAPASLSPARRPIIQATAP